MAQSQTAFRIQGGRQQFNHDLQFFFDGALAVLRHGFRGVSPRSFDAFQRHLLTDLVATARLLNENHNQPPAEPPIDPTFARECWLLGDLAGLAMFGPVILGRIINRNNYSAEDILIEFAVPNIRTAQAVWSGLCAMADATRSGSHR